MSRILVVEDDRTTRHLITRVLEAEGISVASAADGARALDKLKRSEFDLILLDIWMPRMNGLEMLARLREDQAARVPNVVVLTSDDTPQTLLKAVQERAYQYLTKPVEPKQLLEVVRGALAAPRPSAAIEVLSGRPNWVELVVPCDLSVAERIQGFLGRLEADLPEDVRDSVGRVFRELLLNAIEWGGKLDPSRKVRISYVRAKRMLLYRIADPGPGFSFEALNHAAVGHTPEDPLAHMAVREEKGLRPGGFGILMARTMVDELVYNEKQNEVLFVKYLD
jgi:CheY-like chemotaxis protein/anti-sigma regulatory factor (Ser/Thr protein kinase)